MEGISDSTLRMWLPGDLLGFGWAAPWSLLAAVVVIASITLSRCREARYRRLLVWTVAVVFFVVSVANFVAYRRMETRLFSSLRTPTHHGAPLAVRMEGSVKGKVPRVSRTADRPCPSGVVAASRAS